MTTAAIRLARSRLDGPVSGTPRRLARCWLRSAHHRPIVRVLSTKFYPLGSDRRLQRTRPRALFSDQGNLRTVLPFVADKNGWEEAMRVATGAMAAGLGAAIAAAAMAASPAPGTLKRG